MDAGRQVRGRIRLREEPGDADQFRGSQLPLSAARDTNHGVAGERRRGEVHGRVQFVVQFLLTPGGLAARIVIAKDRPGLLFRQIEALDQNYGDLESLRVSPLPLNSRVHPRDMVTGSFDGLSHRLGFSLAT